MIKNLKEDLIEGLKGLTDDQILKSIGYAKPNCKNHDRLKKVLADDLLGLGSGDFDLKYSSAEFLFQLCKLVRIDVDKSQLIISTTVKYLSEDQQAFKPYIWVNTKFKRTSQSLIALSACEKFRHIHFPNGFWRLSLEGQLQEAKALAQKHMKEMGGKLPMWGQVHDYWFFYEPRKVYVLSPEGDILENKSLPLKHQ